MDAMKGREAAIEGFGWGALAGIVLVALMYGAGSLLGLKPLTQALNEPLLAVMPGFIFGFLIDTLQHAGKVVEEIGLVVAMVVALGLLGAAWSWTALRWRFQYSALVFALAGWAIVAVVLLPITGMGFLGLSAGPTTPVIWAALFAIYGVVLQLGGRPSAAEATDLQRRRLLGAIPLGIGAASLGLLGVLRVPSWYQAVASPSEAGLTGPSPEITPVAHFYVVSKNISDPRVDGSAWRLNIGGLVDKPQRISLSDLRARPSTSEFATLECISNDVGGGLMSTGSFTGVRLRDLIATASPSPGATWVGFQAVDGYAESLPLNVVNGEPSILVAYELNGSPLPSSHGYPARVIIPGRYGMKGPKWLTSINLVDHESGGFWEAQGWDHNAFVRTTARFDVPRDGDTIRHGAVQLAGVAFAGTRGIGMVEYSTDGGQTWAPASFKAPLSELTWVLWTADWTPAGEGGFTLKVRATDGSGALQDATSRMSYPAGATGYHTIRVDVSK
ncbi:MAG: molybdopterin-binding oxidoreductase [Chloroflexi bacterium]|nr:MAG: molybdopterin-binding oxidoreductase [Chloroflexota bacterium]